ncbi:MAG TPA: DMT family transporter [Hyphomicrobiaceae bacterium]|nr:DMT family transporter [Hyphomicrobiaceae bacterium]
MPGLWIVFTLLAAGGQTLRNALQRELTASLGTTAATHVRFLYGLPFALVFLLLSVLHARQPVPVPGTAALAWLLGGALSQIAGTAMLLAAMRERSFVVITAYSKTEPVLVALFGLAVLGDALSWPLALAIAIATAGVLVVSWPKAAAAETFSPSAVGYGLASAAMFGLAAIGYRGGVKAMPGDALYLNASTLLVIALAVQTTLLTLYLLVAERQNLIALLRSWRTSLKAGFLGAFASQMWLLAFTLETAAKVRTLALVEILMAQVISRSMFRQSLASREGLGIALIVAGVALLLNL